MMVDGSAVVYPVLYTEHVYCSSNSRSMLANVNQNYFFYYIFIIPICLVVILLLL